MAGVLGGLVFVLALALALPDAELVPFELIAAVTLLLLAGAGAAAGRVAGRAWPVAVLAAWPGAIIGFGLAASQPEWAAAWLLVPAAALLGGAFGGRFLGR